MAAESVWIADFARNGKRNFRYHRPGSERTPCGYWHGSPVERGEFVSEAAAKKLGGSRCVRCWPVPRAR